MAVVVTRPQAEGERWAARLREHGIDAIVLPLLAIAPPLDAQALNAVASQVHRYAAAMFVSANAVEGFFAAAGAFAGPRAWAPGPATRDALLRVGVPAARIDAPSENADQFDSESLWLQVAGQLGTGDRLLLVRGSDGEGRSQGRDWLAQQLAARGVAVDTVVAYRRELPAWSGEQRALAQRCAGDGSLWLFSSSEAVGNLRTLLPAQDWSQARALATHPRIAQAVEAAGFGVVRSARPSFADVVGSVKSDR